MKVLVFGNPLVKKDSIALRLVPALRKAFPGVEFKEFDGAENLEAEGGDLLILDPADGLREVSLLEGTGALETGKAYSMHDFDLAITLKLLLKMGRIRSVRIIAVPSSFPPRKALPGVRRTISSLLSGSG